MEYAQSLAAHLGVKRLAHSSTDCSSQSNNLHIILVTLASMIGSDPPKQ